MAKENEAKDCEIGKLRESRTLVKSQLKELEEKHAGLTKSLGDLEIQYSLSQERVSFLEGSSDSYVIE